MVVLVAGRSSVAVDPASVGGLGKPTFGDRPTRIDSADRPARGGPANRLLGGTTRLLEFRMIFIMCCDKEDSAASACTVATAGSIRRCHQRALPHEPGGGQPRATLRERSDGPAQW